MLKKWVCAVNSGIVDDIIACYCVDASLFATFDEKPLKSRAVSYTHLTLTTICSV